jgi:ABC-type xylose transport system substrate-binding protein
MGEWWKEVNTPSVSNHVVSIFLESQDILSLTKIIEKIIKTYDIKLVSYENIINEESKDTYLVL